MESHQKYLLLIDHSPCNEQLAEYFAKFDYKIIQLQKLSELKKQATHPAALLVNHSLFETESFTVDDLYQQYPVPLIVIADSPNEDLCVKMLEAGADDFLVKPLHPRELHARINAIARRVLHSTQETDKEREVLVFADWRLYPASRQVFNRGSNQELQLSAGEYDLLLAFLRQPQRVLGREFLLQITKNTDLNPFDRRIDVQISRLRQKIETDAKKPALIKTIRNGGYLFTAQVHTMKESERE